MKTIFIGMGVITGVQLEDSMSTFCEQVEELGDCYVGLWKNQEGTVFIEEVTLLPYKEEQLDTIKSQFPHEEAFYVAKVVSKTLYEGIDLHDLLDMITLRPLEGMTLHYENGVVNKLNCIEGELIPCK